MPLLNAFKLHLNARLPLLFKLSLYRIQIIPDYAALARIAVSVLNSFKLHPYVSAPYAFNLYLYIMQITSNYVRLVLIVALASNSLSYVSI